MAYKRNNAIVLTLLRDYSLTLQNHEVITMYTVINR